MNKLFFNSNTILVFHISGGGGNNRKLSCRGEGRIGDYADDLFSPVIRDDNDPEVVCDDERPDAEWTNDQGRSVGLTNAMVASGIGRIDIDYDYDTTYSIQLSDIDYTSPEAWAMVHHSDAFTREQAILYFTNGESEKNIHAILGELDVSEEEYNDIIND